jgi:membrane-bound lytic murein transglycosylase MltF
MKAREHFGAGDPIRNPGAAAERARLDEVRGLMQRYASSYSLDWLLLAAQAFQESGLDHSRRSHVGAIGIMQLMPATARDPRVGIPDIEKLDRNIEAGTKYLRFVIDRYYAQQPMTDLDKALFALASYNAGPARVAKLRQEAAKSGLDPNVWFGHVEVVAARRIGAETVDYVRNIYKYYLAYRLLEDQHRSRGTVASARTT